MDVKHKKEKKSSKKDKEKKKSEDERNSVRGSFDPTYNSKDGANIGMKFHINPDLKKKLLG